MKETFEQISILGIRVDIISLDELLEYALLAIRNREKVVITNVNVHAVNIACEVGWFRDFINHSQIVFCDGFGVKWAARFLKRKKLHRFTPPDWFDALAVACAREGFSIYFLGAQQDVVEKAAAVLKERHPGLKIIETHHGFFDKKITSSENQEVVDGINTLRPDLLVVGFGMPSQEKWIRENYSGLNTHVIIPVGAFFDYVSGEVVRAPRWMTKNGLEWLGRLIIEPRRLWKRYIIGNPLFLWRIFIYDILGFSLPNQ